MPVSPYYNFMTYAPTQNMYEDIVIESIKHRGVNVKYIPKKAIKFDKLFYEDTLKRFDDAFEIEMYIETYEKFEGDKEYINKFGLEIRDQIRLTVSKKRFRESLIDGILSETNYRFYTEDGILLTQETINYDIDRDRPQEGDLIYLPLTDAIFEIRFVEPEVAYYQFGKLYMYELKCELFEYSAERFATPDANVNTIETNFSLDSFGYGILNEDATTILLEDYPFGQMILENDNIENVDIHAQNEYIQDSVDDLLVNNEAHKLIQRSKF